MTSDRHPVAVVDAGPTGHVVVCGLHDDGFRVVEQLHATGVPVVMVDADPDPRLLEPLATLGIPYIAADSRLPTTLADAGLARAVALVCMERDDLHTLATSLLARELRPQLRVVAQLRNAAVGRALSEIGVIVLDVAQIAAPSLVDACLQARTRTLDLVPEIRVAEIAVRRAGTLRELYGDLAPLAVRHTGHGAELAPGRDATVAEGDTVVLAGPPEQVGAHIAPTRRATAALTGGARGWKPPKATRSLVRDLALGLDRRLRLVLLALFGLLAVSITLLMTGYRDAHGGMSFLDALYFTVETIGTVGYGDFYFRDQPDWLRLWAVVLMIVGAILATVFFALLTNALVSRRLEETLGKRRITSLEDHAIVVGAGSVGVAVVDVLRGRGTEAVVVEVDESNRFLGRLRSGRVPFMVADATQADTLAAAGLARAQAVVIATTDDLANIETGLAVRDLLGERWDDVPVVVRLFDERLAQTLAGSFGFGNVRSPAALAAPWFVGAALGLDVVDTFYVVDRPMLAARLRVASGSGLIGLAMRDLSARILVASLTREDGSCDFPPRRDTRFAAGDVAHLLGPYEELLRLLRTDVASAAPSGAGSETAVP